MGSGPVAVTGGDLNNDGLFDLVVANSGDHTVTVLQNTGLANFVTAQTINTGQNPVLNSVDIQRGF